jgi:uncharacterized protein
MTLTDPLTFTFILLTGAFTAALVQGSTGFGSGLVLNAFWLHIMEPAIAIPLNVVTSFIMSGVPIIKLRKTLDFSILRRFIFFGIIGVPIGIFLLTIADPNKFKLSIGIFLVIYSILALNISSFSIKVNIYKPIDNFIGFISGIMGGFSALQGILPTIWVGLQRLPKKTQRGTFEPFIFITSFVSISSFIIVGLFTIEMFYMLLKIMPAIFLGSWIGIKIYALINEALFRQVILGLIFLAGLVLLF